MRKIMTLLFALAVATVSAPAFSGGGAGVHLDKAPIDIYDKESLKRGAKLFVDNCLSCHSAHFMRYKRMGDDLGMTVEETKALIHTGAKIHDTMNVAMPQDKSAKWFGTPPPDLSVISRSRNADWIYTYLRSFYLDDSRPMGVNNTVFPDVGMPHVLWKLQGWQQKIEQGEGDHKEIKLMADGTGTMKPVEYDAAVADLTNFLVYVGEPVKSYRQTLGWYVLAFLFIFFIVAYMLKKEYWKDVH